jgi:hypothetical protein
MRIAALPPVRDLADKEPFNEALEALAAFREAHLGLAEAYIARRVRDPLGTGGTPYLTWLKQLIDETRATRSDERQVPRDALVRAVQPWQLGPDPAIVLPAAR